MGDSWQQYAGASGLTHFIMGNSGQSKVPCNEAFVCASQRTFRWPRGGHLILGYGFASFDDRQEPVPLTRLA